MQFSDFDQVGVKVLSSLVSDPEVGPALSGAPQRWRMKLCAVGHGDERTVGVSSTVPRYNASLPLHTYLSCHRTRGRLRWLIRSGLLCVHMHPRHGVGAKWKSGISLSVLARQLLKMRLHCNSKYISLLCECNVLNYCISGNCNILFCVTFVTRYSQHCSVWAALTVKS